MGMRRSRADDNRCVPPADGDGEHSPDRRPRSRPPVRTRGRGTAAGRRGRPPVRRLRGADGPFRDAGGGRAIGRAGAPRPPGGDPRRPSGGDPRRSRCPVLSGLRRAAPLPPLAWAASPSSSWRKPRRRRCAHWGTPCAFRRGAARSPASPSPQPSHSQPIANPGFSPDAAALASLPSTRIPCSDRHRSVRRLAGGILAATSSPGANCCGINAAPDAEPSRYREPQDRPRSIWMLRGQSSSSTPTRTTGTSARRRRYNASSLLHRRRRGDDASARSAARSWDTRCVRGLAGSGAPPLARARRTPAHRHRLRSCLRRPSCARDPHPSPSPSRKPCATTLHKPASSLSVGVSDAASIQAGLCDVRASAEAALYAPSPKRPPAPSAPRPGAHPRGPPSAPYPGATADDRGGFGSKERRRTGRPLVRGDARATSTSQR